MSRRASNIAMAAAVAAFAVACSDSPVQPSEESSLTPSTRFAAPAEDQVVAGEVIVKVKSGADVGTVGRRNGAQFKARGYQGAFDILATAPGNEVAAAARLKADPDVEYAEPNYLRQVDAIDPRLWAFRNPGGLNMTFCCGDSRTGQLLPASYASLADADEDNIEGYAAGGSPVVIGSIDTGVDFTHPEFTGRLIAGKDWFANDNDPNDTPDEGHGTHTTGTMGGSTVGVAGVAGAADKVQVYVQRVCGPGGCPTSAIVNAIRAAADVPGMVAMNLSLGGNSESTAEKNAIAYATNKGVLVIASAGNSGAGKVACPACDPNAISVSATNWKDELAAYSQWGKGLDIAAPGGYCYSNTTPEGCIFSAIVKGYTGGDAYDGPLSTTANGAKYAWMLGTSMAAPQVTGTAAIVASVTGLRGNDLRNRILSTADDKGAAGYDTKFGNGRLNSYRAVTGNTLEESVRP